VRGMLGKLAKAVFGNVRVKLLALGIAVTVWVYANGRLKEELTLSVPLQVRLPKGYELVYQSHQQVELRFRGPGSLIRKRQEEKARGQLLMTVRLEEAQAGKGRLNLPVSPDWLNVPEREMVQLGVRVVSPPAAQLFVSKRATRMLPVEVQLEGRAREGYAVRSVSAVPPEVSVTGPELAFEQIKKIRTDKVSIMDLEGDRRAFPTLISHEKLTLTEGLVVPVNLTATPSQVAVYVRIGPTAEKEGRRIDGVPLGLLMPPGFPYDVEIGDGTGLVTVSVVVSGLPQEVREVARESVRAYVDLYGLKDQEIAPGASAPSREKVHVSLPENLSVQVKSVEPDYVVLRLTNPAQ